MTYDGDLDLALTGARTDGTHVVMRNMLPAATASRGLHVRVVDAKGRATRAGAEVRLFAAGTTRVLGSQLVDAGSGYDSQNDMPVHFGVPAGVARVDVDRSGTAGASAPGDAAIATEEDRARCRRVNHPAVRW